MSYDLNKIFTNDWNVVLKPFLATPEFTSILDHVNSEISKGKVIYPPKKDVFKAFNVCSFVDTKVVILALDPYINEGQANGLAMAVNEGISWPPTLQHLMVEFTDDIGKEMDTTFKTYAQKGVLFLNTALTVEKGKTKSHWDIWQPFTRFVFNQLELRGNIIYVLLGKEAQEYENLIYDEQIPIIKAVHPNAQSYRSNAGFYGSKIFSRVNSALIKQGHAAIF